MKPTYLGLFSRVSFSPWKDNAQCTIYIAKFMAFGLLSNIFILIKFIYRYLIRSIIVSPFFLYILGLDISHLFFYNFLPIINVLLSHVSCQTHCSGEVECDKYRRKYRLRYGMYNLWVGWKTKAAEFVCASGNGVLQIQQAFELFRGDYII